MPAPSTLGTFLRSFSWAHARQLDAVAGRLLARAWAAGGGPGDSPLIIDVDSTVCEVYGAKKQGARYGYTKTTPPRWRLIAIPGHVTRSARRTTMHLARDWPWRQAFLVALRAVRDLEVCLT